MVSPLSIIMYILLVFRYIFLFFTTSSVLAIRRTSFCEVNYSVVSSTDDSFKDEARVLLLWVGSLVTLHTFVFTYITSVVKPVHFFMARNRVSKNRFKRLSSVSIVMCNLLMFYIMWIYWIYWFYFLCI